VVLRRKALESGDLLLFFPIPGNQENQTDTKGTLSLDQYRMPVERSRQIALMPA
jgi:peptide deformylase